MAEIITLYKDGEPAHCEKGSQGEREKRAAGFTDGKPGKPTVAPAPETAPPAPPSDDEPPADPDAPPPVRQPKKR